MPCGGGLLVSLFHKPSLEDQLRPSRQLLHVPAGKPASRLGHRTSPAWARLISLPGFDWPHVDYIYRVAHPSLVLIYLITGSLYLLTAFIQFTLFLFSTSDNHKSDFFLVCSF